MKRVLFGVVLLSAIACKNDIHADSHETGAGSWFEHGDAGELWLVHEARVARWNRDGGCDVISDAGLFLPDPSRLCAVMQQARSP